MRLPCRRPTIRRAMVSIAVLAFCLVVIRANYRARLYGDMAIIKVLAVAEHTSWGLAAHAQRVCAPEILNRASLDPRLSGLRPSLHASDPDEVIGSRPGPQVFASVLSVEDGTIAVDAVAEGSATEARSIALAVAGAYIAEQGTSRVVPWTGVFPTRSEFQTKPLGGPWALATAVFLAILASALVLVVPIALVAKWRFKAVVVVPIASWLVLELLMPFSPTWEEVDIVVGAVVSGAFGVWAVRRPWVSLAVALVIWAGAPVIHDGFNAVTLSAQGSLLAWMIGAPIGWAVRSATKRRNLSRKESGALVHD